MQTTDVNFIMKKIHRSHSKRALVCVCGKFFDCYTVHLDIIHFLLNDKNIIIKDIG